MSTRKLGFAGRIAHYFINSKLTPLIMVFSILLGAFAVLQTPREEEPQIVVPMLDVFVEMPGSTAQEVEQRVTTPMEKLIWEIPGVEYIYSTTRPGLSMAIVRFKVGEKEEDSIIKLYNKLYSHFDLFPRRFQADHQAPLDRRRSHSGAHFLEQSLRQLHVAPGGQRSRSRDQEH